MAWCPLLWPTRPRSCSLATDCDITACFHKCANSVHLVVVSGQDERGIPLLVTFRLHLFEEQHHDLRVATGTPRAAELPILILPIDRCPLRNESLASAVLPSRQAIKFLVMCKAHFR